MLREYRPVAFPFFAKSKLDVFREGRAIGQERRGCEAPANGGGVVFWGRQNDDVVQNRKDLRLNVEGMILEPHLRGAEEVLERAKLVAVIHRRPLYTQGCG